MPKEKKLEAISGHMRSYWIVSSTFHRFLPCILVHLTHGYRLQKSGGAYLPHLLVMGGCEYRSHCRNHSYSRPFQACNQDSDSTSISGASKSTQRFLLITMRVFLCLVLLGIIGELVYKTMWKANRRVENNQG